MNMPRWWWGALALAVLMLVLVAAVSPEQLTVILYKGALLSFAVVASTLIDRLFFKQERKDTINANIARALIFVAVVLGVTLGA